MKVVVPVFVIVTPWANADPGTIAPSMLIFARPAKVTVTAAVEFWDRLSPRKTSVFPAPLAVSVRPELVDVIFPNPIESVVFDPDNVIFLLPEIVTFPVPRSRLFAAVLLAVPNVNPSASAQDWFAALVTGAPLVLLIVVFAEIVSAPLPSALALLILSVPALSVVPPVWVLFPERIQVPFPLFVIDVVLVALLFTTLPAISPVPLPLSVIDLLAFPDALKLLVNFNEPDDCEISKLMLEELFEAKLSTLSVTSLPEPVYLRVYV